MLEQLNFYMTQATPALMEDRREYIERVIVGKLRRGIDAMKKWTPEMATQPDSLALIAAYDAGLKFFAHLGFVNSTQAV